MLPLLIAFLTLFGYYDFPKCYRNHEKNFYERGVVITALGFYNIPQAQWDPIVRKLNREGKGVWEGVRNRARKIRPNPLWKPFQPEPSMKLLREELFKVFEKVMQESNVGNRSDDRALFEWIWDHQPQSLEFCLDLDAKKELLG